MTKFINSPEAVTAELLEGYVLAYPDQVALAAENIVVRKNPKSEDKVAIVTLGGSGHEPALSGFVGDGMLDCSVVGDVFAAPGAQRLFQALQLMKREAGILLVVLNHSGDVMSANMACQLAERAGIKVRKVLTYDDVSAGIGAPKEDLLTFEGHRIFLSHGDRLSVKSGVERITAYGASKGADIILYGHTHVPAEHYFHAGDTVLDAVLSRPTYVICPGSIREGRDGFDPGFGVLEISDRHVLWNRVSLI